MTVGFLRESPVYCVVYACLFQLLMCIIALVVPRKYRTAAVLFGRSLE